MKKTATKRAAAVKAVKARPKKSAAAGRKRPPLSAAPRQPTAAEAWKRFGRELQTALADLDEDEYLILSIKGTSRFVQFAAQGTSGMRVEAVSNYFLEDAEQLSDVHHKLLLKLGWRAPTNLPDEFGHKPDGSANYFLDLARPVPFGDVARLAVDTLRGVHSAEHPGDLEYRAFAEGGSAIKLPNLGIRGRPK